MASTSKDISLPLTLSGKRKQPLTDIEKCIICQSNKKGKKTVSTENGRMKVKEASYALKDQILSDLSEDEYSRFEYHLSCYKSYVLKGNRTSCVAGLSADDSHENPSDKEEPITIRSKRSSLCVSQNKKPQVCVICNHSSKGKYETQLHRICEVERAKSFLAATRFNLDAVFDRTSTLQDVNSVFAADIMCHKKCINQYILQYKRDLDRQITIEESIPNEVFEAFQNLLSKLQLDSNGYALSDCRIIVNNALQPDQHICNRKLKHMLVDHFGEEICFTYPKDRNKSQMFFSSKISSVSLSEKIRAFDCVKLCAEKLRKECLDYDFGLTGKFGDANDLTLSMYDYESGRPENWKIFFDKLLPSHSKSKQVIKKCDSIFQIAYTLVHDGRKKTPMHISIAQTIHEASRSKTLIRVLNHLGLCMSYDELERQDHSLVCRTLKRNEKYRLPLPPVINSSIPIHGAMDNFDHEEDTKSGIGGSHDTVLVLFQETSEQPVHTEEMSYAHTFSIDKRKRALGFTLPCQQLLKSGKGNKRGDIPHDYVSYASQDAKGAAVDGWEKDCLWFLSRFLIKSNVSDHLLPEVSGVPSWSAFNSLISNDSKKPTTIAFTPIIPHPATQYDTIFTCMVNFQDAFLQTGQECGSLWCDEGVYRIAKELQLLQPEKFSNIFLGLGGFHMAKVVISCIGKYLEDSGVEHVFTENEIFGPKIVQSILKGSHYSRALRGLSLLEEVMHQLLWKQFLQQQGDSLNLTKLFSEVALLQRYCNEKNSRESQSTLEKCKELLHDIIPTYDKFVAKGEDQSDIFKYWCTFITYLFPLLRDLTRSLREGNWELHLSAVQRALPLFFAFDKTHYSRWGSVFYEDCLQLPYKFPSIHAEFLKGQFVVKNSTRKFSNVPMDQALEQMYNKPAKGHGGIVGITRRKEAVAQYDLTRQEKFLISAFLREFCGLNDEDECSLHHEFSTATTKHDEISIKQMLAYIQERDNPFDLLNNKKMRNFVTGKETSDEKSKYLLNCISLGQQAYEEFVKTRFKDKEKSLFDPIKKTSKQHKICKDSTADIQKDTNNALHIIDIARARGYDISQLLTYEITSNSYYLTKDGYLRKSLKSELTHVIEKRLKEPAPQKVPFSDATHPTAIVFDFMAYARKISVTQMKLKTFGDMAAHLWKVFSSMSATCKRIDVVFDIYELGSIKDIERMRRRKVDPIEVFINRNDTPLPVDIERFWASSKNKERLQEFFIKWLIHKVTQGTENVSISIYLGGSHEDDLFKCMRISSQTVADVPTLHCQHNEADDRMLLHINHAICTESFKRVVVASPDTDVLVCLLYHFSETWKFSGLEELWVLCGQGNTKRALPVHDLVQTMSRALVSVLPALHALSGCDTTSKVSTKLSVFKAAEQGGLELLKDFGKNNELSHDVEIKAEQFLAHAIGGVNIDTFNELRYFLYHHKSIKNNFEKLVPTSNSIQLHIKRAFLQCYHWINATKATVDILNPVDYGYILKDDFLVPLIVSEPNQPPDFPFPCTCKKCFRSNVCPCRIADIMCCEFCKCDINGQCSNPRNNIKESHDRSKDSEDGLIVEC